MKVIIIAVKNNKTYGYGFNKNCSEEQMKEAIKKVFSVFDSYIVIM
jgi:hypothetical protein